MREFTHSEAVVIRRGAWYLLLMLTVALFAFGMYRAALFLEEVVSEPRGSRSNQQGDSPEPASYSQYEEVISIHTPGFARSRASATNPRPTPVYPISRSLTNRQGKTIEAEILGRPDARSIKIRRNEDGTTYLIQVANLSPEDVEFINDLPVSPES